MELSLLHMHYGSSAKCSLSCASVTQPTMVCASFRSAARRHGSVTHLAGSYMDHLLWLGHQVASKDGVSTTPMATGRRRSCLYLVISQRALFD